MPTRLWCVGGSLDSLVAGRRNNEKILRYLVAVYFFETCTSI